MDDKYMWIYALLEELDMPRGTDFILDELIKDLSDEQVERFVTRFRKEHVNP